MNLNIQIIGTLKCKETQKTIRFFKEHNIKSHFVNLVERPLSKGELQSISNKIPLEDLINKNGKEYKKSGMEYMVFDLEEELLDKPLLLTTPIVRNGKKDVTLGYKPDVWKAWIKEERDGA